MPTCSRSLSKAERKQQHDSDPAGTFAHNLRTGRFRRKKRPAVFQAFHNLALGVHG
jgi:hypothetical protein